MTEPNNSPTENIISLGKILQQKREDLKLEIKQAATFLNIKEAALLAIENDEINTLQDKRLYAYGLVRSYAKFLKIDEKIIEEQIKLLHFKSNVENKKHLLLNIGEDDKLSPTKDDFFNFLLISILLFLILLSIYSINSSKNSISNQEIISKFEQIDGRK
jgi:cytoskeletal protein RodZ